MSTVSIPGRLYGEPRTNIDDVTCKPLDGKTAFMTFSVGEYDFKKRGNNFFDCTCFGKTAELVYKFYSVGRSVVVEGNLDQEEYNTADGRKVRKIRVIAHRVIFLTDGESTIAKQEEKRETVVEEEESEGDVPFSYSKSSDDEDDTLPF